MRRLLLLLAFAAGALSAAADSPKPLAAGLKNPRAVAVGPKGTVFVAVAGEPGKDGDGAVLVLDGDKLVPFASGLDDPAGIAVGQQWLFVTDKQRVWKIDAKGKAAVVAKADDFPTRPNDLAGVSVDEKGTAYVADRGGPVYRIPPKGKPAVALAADRLPGAKPAANILLDGASHLLVADGSALHRVRLADGMAEPVAGGVGRALTWDHYGRLFAATATGGLTVVPRPGEKPIPLPGPVGPLADLAYDPANKRLLALDSAAGTLSAVPAVVPGWEVDETPLPLKTAVAFPNLKWTGWQPESDDGRPTPFRPITLTHAGDGSNRVFVATQQGVVHVFPNDQAATETKLFADLRDRVKYNDKTNEEGFLGLAFHPRFKDTGEVFVFYTPKQPTGGEMVNLVSRFRVRKDDPAKLDPASEEVILRYTKPFWNHDGGTILFGPDGCLYVAHGDGGSANDPFDNGQNLNSLLGKVLRIDVNKAENGNKYAVPPDNPFVGRKDARPEIWAYGLRNVWRMAFDKKTGQLWAGDVGQNLYEEICILTRGGNYGWNRRESLHPFGAKGVGHNKGMIDPIWEYHHDVGKSITGGGVYRGPRLPELDGWYLYADYIANKTWALKYDDKQGRVVANRPIAGDVQVFSFGEDEKGEMYLLTLAANGKGIYWITK